MNVAIAGGHGKVGRLLIARLRERGDEVRSLDRRPEHADDLRAAGAEPVVCDLETAGLVEIEAAIEGMDAAVFSVGAGPGSGPEPKWRIDFAGALKLAAAARLADVRRYVMVSSIGADPNAEGEDAFAVYRRAKGAADREVQGSGLDFTIVRPTGLTDEKGTGRVQAGEHAERGKISREDVAEVLAVSLHEPATIGKTFEVTSGDQPVEEAIAALAPGRSD
jgi:uncharacterized protein YbjT (DUF2867 family)